MPIAPILVVATVATVVPNEMNAPMPDFSERNYEDLEKIARKGQKQAQLELGRRYEEGVGVERDICKAVKWYKLAAQDSVHRNLVYSGPVGSERYGRAIEVGPPTIENGLIEAKNALSRLSCKHK